jgi:uncharacterized membrane protein YozB (DUF420 family)
MTTNTLNQSELKYGAEVSLDRWIFVLMALLLLVTVLTGFIPTSLEKIAAVQAGERAPFLPVLHVHAFLMGAWILLLLVQTSLVASDNRALHRQLGITAVVLMPAMVVTGFLLVPANFGIIWNLNPEIVPAQVIAETKVIISNIALLQIRIGILFPIMVGLALYYRKTDSDTHKRLMILATVLPIPAAVDRIFWLPNTMPDSPIGPDFYTLLLVLPLFAFDLLKKKGIPRAYVIWIAGWLPTAIIMHLLWNSPWWLSTAPKLMGMEG